jgi:Lon protease-like protein
MKKGLIELAVIPFENLVLFPSACVPLYIFDPIYIKLIEDCLKTSRHVALSLSDPINDQFGQAQGGVLRPRKITGYGEIILLKEYPDQSKYILIRGLGKAELLQPAQTYPYLICKANALTNLQEDSISLNTTRMTRLKTILEYWLTNNFPDEQQRELIKADLVSAECILDYLSTFLIQDREIKQILLENTNIQEKLDLVSLLFRSKDPVHEDRYTAEIIKSFELTNTAVGGYS